MIEVEKKFKLTSKKLEAIKKRATFVSKKTFTDIYYDDENFSLTKKDIWLRKRGVIFELKYPFAQKIQGKIINIYDEIIDQKKIANKIKLHDYSDNFSSTLRKNNYRPCCKIKTTRRKYSLDGFTIDIDEMDFVYSLCEIEKMAPSKKEVVKIANQIFAFAKSFGLETKKSIRGKVLEYLWRNNRKHYRALERAGVIIK